MNTAIKIVAFLLTLQTGFSAYITSAPDGVKQGNENSREEIIVSAPFSEQDLLVLTARIARLKAVRPPTGFVTQLDIPKLKAVRPRDSFEDNSVEIESVSDLDVVTTRKIEVGCDSQKSKRMHEDMKRLFSSLNLFSITKKNAKVKAFVKLLPEYLYMKIQKERLRTSLSFRSSKLFRLKKKNAKVKSFVKLSPGYSYVTVPTFSTRGNRHISFFARA